MLKICLCLALVAAASAGYDRCKHNGQFLPNDYDECSYIRCDYGDEPWYDEYGNIKLVEVKMKCAGGSSTNPYKFDPYNPCGETSDKCGAPAHYNSYRPHPKPHGSYPHPEPHHPHQPHYPPHEPHNPHQRYPSGY